MTVVEGPDGRQWRIRRRWAPRLGHESLHGRALRRFRGSFISIAKGVDSFGLLALIVVVGGLGVAFGDGVVGKVTAGATFVTAVVVGLALLLAAIALATTVVDLAVLAALTAVGVLLRLASTRPWDIEATATDGEHHQWRVAGWGRSSERRSEIARNVAAGVVPPVDVLNDVT